jgi:hypothetical protein
MPSRFNHHSFCAGLRGRSLSLALILGLAALWPSPSSAEEKSAASEKKADTTATEKKALASIECAEIAQTGFFNANRVGQFETMSRPFHVTIRNHTGREVETNAQLVGEHSSYARLSFAHSENLPDGAKKLTFDLTGHIASTDESVTTLKIEVKQNKQTLATKEVPVKVIVPFALKYGEPLYEGPAQPGLTHRLLNMTTIPKASVSHPEAKLAVMLVHDVEFTVLDQFGEVLPSFYEGAPVFMALGQSDYENTHRYMRASGSFLDTAGFWQFVGEAKDVTVDPDRARVAKFLSERPAPCTKDQYATYDPLVLQWSIGGHDVGTYLRTMTLIASGDDHKPNLRIDLVYAPEEATPLGLTPKLEDGGN